MIIILSLGLDCQSLKGGIFANIYYSWIGAFTVGAEKLAIVNKNGMNV